MKILLSASLFAVIFSCLFVACRDKPKPTPDDILVLGELARLDKDLPLADAEAAVVNKDFRLWAIGGYVPEVPGFSGSCWKKVKLDDTGIYLLKGGPESDASHITLKIDPFKFAERARPYIKTYNEAMIQWLKEHDKNWREYDACSRVMK
jgi:hypothetical protein